MSFYYSTLQMLDECLEFLETRSSSYEVKLDNLLTLSHLFPLGYHCGWWFQRWHHSDWFGLCGKVWQWKGGSKCFLELMNDNVRYDSCSASFLLQVRVLTLGKNRGKGGAVRMGMLRARWNFAHFKNNKIHFHLYFLTLGERICCLLMLTVPQHSLTW